MTAFSEYTWEVMRTCGVPREDTTGGILMCALGVGSESGEILEHVKHVMYHGHNFDKEHMQKEIGDCLWYLTALSEFCGFSLEDVVQRNMQKLRQRYPAGFSSERSVNRDPTHE